MAGKDADAQGDMVLVLPSFGPPKPSRPLSPPHAGMDRHLRVLDDWNATAVNPWTLGRGRPTGDARTPRPSSSDSRPGRRMDPPRALVPAPALGVRAEGAGAAGGGRAASSAPAAAAPAPARPEDIPVPASDSEDEVLVSSSSDGGPLLGSLGPRRRHPRPKGQGHVPEVAAQRAREVEHDSPTVTVLTFLDVPARRRFFAVDLGDDIAALRSQISGATQTAAGEIVLTARGRLLTDGQRVHQIGDKEIGHVEDTEVVATRRVWRHRLG